MSARHISEHEEMIRLADDILGLVSGRRAMDVGLLAELRLAFARLVNKHCKDEAVSVRNAVRRGLLCPRLVSSFEGQLNGWRADLASCNAEWPLPRVAEDPAGFRQRFAAIAAALRAYIARENRDILAALKD